jgi:hypothetical protein
MSLGAAACELLLPTHEQDVAVDGGGGANDGDAVGASCSPIHPPDSPPQPEGGIGADLGTLNVVAAFETFPNPDASAASVGLDLDHLCTCPDREACVSREQTKHCDLSGGRDTAGNDFLGVAFGGAFTATKAGDVNARIASGHISFLVDIRGYNGTRNQSKLLVAIYDSPGRYVDDPDGGGGKVTAPPAWDGNDEWAVDCTFSKASCIGKMTDVLWLGDGGITPGSIVDETAYVRDGVLVAFFPTLILNAELTTAKMSNVTLFATITPELGSYRLDGQIAGRSTTAEMLLTASRLKSANGTPLCGSNPDLVPVKATICRAADLPVDPAADGKDSPCGATSFAIPFTARPAKIGYRFDKGATPPGCDGSVDDCDQD